MTPTPPDLYEVLIVRHGYRNTVKSDAFLNYSVYGDADEPIRLDYFFWVVRNAERTILVDTGYSRHGGLSRNREIIVAPADAYAALGIRPQDAPPVVVTHAHYDHIGNLGLFPSSQIHIARSEYDFWTGAYGTRDLFHHSVEDDELAVLVRAHEDGRVRFFDDGVELAPGVRVTVVGGHTPGQAVVEVDTREGTVLLASDAIHFYEEYERDRPFSSVADLVGMYAAFDHVRELEASGRVAHVVSGHDADTLGRFPAYEVGLGDNVAIIGRLDAEGQP